MQDEILAAIKEVEGRDVPVERMERFAFYSRAREAFAIVATGEQRGYGNVILKKGVIFPD